MGCGATSGASRVSGVWVWTWGGSGEVGLGRLGVFMGEATIGAGKVSGVWVWVPGLDFRPCGRAWSGTGVWALVWLPWLDDGLGSSWDHLRMRWVRLRLCWEWGDDVLASWVELVSLVGLVGASVSSCWGVSCGQVARVVMVASVGSGALLWVWVEFLVVCWAIRSSRTAGIQLWVWLVLMVADLTAMKSVASVGQVTLVVELVAVAFSLRESFTVGTLWWVWVALSVVRWAVVGVDA